MIHSPLSPYETFESMLEETESFDQSTRFVNIKMIIYRLKYLFLVNCRNSYISFNYRLTGNEIVNLIESHELDSLRSRGYCITIA